MILSLLVAADEHNVIGKNNQLPWTLPRDLKYFKNQTWGMTLLMGRKTFESLGKPLGGRKNIVITRNTDWQQDGVFVVHTIADAVKKAEEFAVAELIVIGGAEIFKQVLPQAQRIYLTRIYHQFDGDAFFPEFAQDEWQLIREQRFPADEKNAYPHSFQVWERK